MNVINLFISVSSRLNNDGERIFSIIVPYLTWIHLAAELLKSYEEISLQRSSNWQRLCLREESPISFHFSLSLLDNDDQSIRSFGISIRIPRRLLERNSCLHRHQQAENNIPYQQLKSQSIKVSSHVFSIRKIQMKISATQRYNAVRTIQFFSNQRQVQAIVDLKNNPTNE
jgi:hypothetical protein